VWQGAESGAHDVYGRVIQGERRCVSRFQRTDRSWFDERDGEETAVIMMKMTWPEVTPELYDRVREIVGWERDSPPGGLFHVAAFDEHGLHVIDVWDSPEQFNDFVVNRLNPGVAQVGISGQPHVELLPVYALHTPAFQPA
jgi:hypothetical protein